MSLSVSQCLDLVNSTRDHFTLDKLSVALNYPRYEVLNDILKNFKKVGAGENWETNIQLTDATNGGQVGMLFHNDTSNQTDTDKKVVTPWRRYTNNCSYDRIAMSINKAEKTRVYNYLKSKMTSMYRKSADDMQNIFWGAPTGAADSDSAYGVSSWLTLGTDNTDGFTGGKASYQDGNTFNPGGLDPTVYSKWKSYYGDHNGNLGETLLDQLGDACRATDFEAPMSPGKVDGVDEGGLERMRFYTSNEVIKQIEKVARNSDDRIGYDLGKYKGKTLYKGIPFNYVKILDTANANLYGTNPLYAVNFDQLYPVVLEDWYFQPDTDKNAFSHTVMTQYHDLVWNLHCENRQQAGFLISQQ
jgi:hypothetical protein